MSLALVLSLVVAAQTPKAAPPPKTPAATSPTIPSFTLPKGLTKGLTPKSVSFGSTLTVVVTNVPKPPAAKKPPSAKELMAGEKLYKQRCVLCHGDAGAADGVGARRIEPEPQHLNDVIWQANVTDDEIAKAILEGGAAVSRSPMMPANPDLKTKAPELKSLVSYVRGLRAPFGSALASVALADKTSIAVHGVADDKGTATLVLPDLPKGPAVITVLVDGDGTVGCTLNVDVQADQTLTCAAPAPAPPTKK